MRHLVPYAFGFFTLLAVGAPHECSADPLNPDQQERAARLRVVADCAADRWENPNHPSVVTLNAARLNDLELLRHGASGTYVERWRSGGTRGQGAWRFDEHATGSLAWPAAGRQPAGKSDALLVANNILALQPFTPTFELDGDGLVLFRAKYDFEGRETRAILSGEAHQNRIMGEWTHPNLEMVHEATKEGLWQERRKKGGTYRQGSWQVHDDGTYVVELDNNKGRFRIWLANHDKLVIVEFDDTGALDGNGAILSRDRR